MARDPDDGSRVRWRRRAAPLGITLISAAAGLLAWQATVLLGPARVSSGSGTEPVLPSEAESVRVATAAPARGSPSTSAATSSVSPLRRRASPPTPATPPRDSPIPQDGWSPVPLPAQRAAAPTSARANGAGATRAPLHRNSPAGGRASDQKPAADAESAAPDAKGSEEASGDEEPVRRPLSGWVFDPGGRPVPDLQVFAAPRRLFSGAAAGGAAMGTRATARTGPDGAFSFAPLADGEYLVTTQETERYEAASVAIRAGADAAAITVEEKWGESLRVQGTVLSDGGMPVKAVRVEPAGDPRLASYTDERGRYGLVLKRRRASEQPIRFLKEGFREARLEVAWDGVSDPVTLDAVIVRTSSLATVTGSITGEDGSAVSLALVQLYSTSLGRSYRTSSDQSGLFVFPQVEEGEDYRLWVRPPAGYHDHRQEGVVVAGSGLEIPIALRRSSEVRLTGQMVDPDGRPVPNLGLWLISGSGGKGPLMVTSDGQGRFVAGPLPEGEIVLQTRALPFLSVSGITVSAGSSSDVQIPLDVGTQALAGHVVDADGAPVPGARVTLFWSEQRGGLRSGSRREAPVDGAGYFLFTQLGSGTHTVSVTAPGYRAATIDHRVSVDAPEIVVRMEKGAR